MNTSHDHWSNIDVSLKKLSYYLSGLVRQTNKFAFQHSSINFCMTSTTHLLNCNSPALSKESPALRVTRTERLTKKELRALKRNLLIYILLNPSLKNQKVKWLETIYLKEYLEIKIFEPDFFDVCVKECFHVRYIFILSIKSTNILYQDVLSCMELTMLLKPVLAYVPILYLLSIPDDPSFLVFSEGIKCKHWPEIGEELKNLFMLKSCH